MKERIAKGRDREGVLERSLRGTAERRVGAAKSEEILGWKVRGDKGNIPTVMREY